MGVKLGTSGVDLRLGTATPATVRLGSSHIWSPPIAIAGLYSWWDFADAGTMTLNGGNISQIADKSGNGRHMTQGTAAAQPALIPNGRFSRSLARFGGSQWLLGASAADWKFLHYGTDKYAVFVAAQIGVALYSGGILGTGFWAGDESGFNLNVSYNSLSPTMSSAYATMLSYGVNEGYIASPELYPFNGAEQWAYGLFGDPASAAPEDALTMVLQNGSTTVSAEQYWVDDATATDELPPTALAIGAPRGPGGYGQGPLFIGDIYEVLIYRRSTALTNDERTKVFDYLKARWQL